MEYEILAEELDEKDYHSIINDFERTEGFSSRVGSRYIHNGEEKALLFIGGSLKSKQGYIQVVDPENYTLEKAKHIISNALEKKLIKSISKLQTKNL